MYTLVCWSTPQVHMNSKFTLKLSTKCRQLGDTIKIYCVSKFFLGEAIAAPCTAGAPPMYKTTFYRSNEIELTKEMKDY